MSFIAFCFRKATHTWQPTEANKFSSLSSEAPWGLGLEELGLVVNLPPAYLLLHCFTKMSTFREGRGSHRAQRENILSLL